MRSRVGWATYLLATALACGTTAVESAPSAPGITLERVRASFAPEVPIGDRMITLVRIDPARYRFRLLTAERDGGARTLDAWVRDHDLAGAINASMYEPDGRSTAMLIQDGAARTAADDPRFGGFVAIDPRGALEVIGRDCAGVDVPTLRARDGSLVQSYRLLDCEGRAIRWVDPKQYSAAAIGTDRDGRVVLVHARTPYRMTELARMLAAPALRLRAMVFVEGGPEATLVVGEPRVREVGSYESTFHESDDNHEQWRLPNVIGFTER